MFDVEFSFQKTIACRRVEPDSKNSQNNKTSKLELLRTGSRKFKTHHFDKELIELRYS